MEILIVLMVIFAVVALRAKAVSSYNGFFFLRDEIDINPTKTKFFKDIIEKKSHK